MIVYPLPQRPNGRDVEFVIRLEHAITRLGAPYGYDGDPLAEHFPDAKTESDLWAACDLLDALPAKLRNHDRRVAYRMCQAAVFGRTRTDDNRIAPSAPAADAKLARERRRASA